MAIPSNLYEQVKESLERLDLFLVGDMHAKISPENYPEIYAYTNSIINRALLVLPNNTLLLKVKIIIDALNKSIKEKNYTSAEIQGYINQIERIIKALDQLKSELSAANTVEGVATEEEPSIEETEQVQAATKKPPKPLPQPKLKKENVPSEQTVRVVAEQLAANKPQVKVTETKKPNAKKFRDYINKFVKKKKPVHLGYTPSKAYENISKALSNYEHELEKSKVGKYDISRAKKLQIAYQALSFAFKKIDDSGEFSDKQISVLQRAQRIQESFANETMWEIKKIVDASDEVATYKKMKAEYERRIKKFQQEVSANPAIFLSKGSRNEIRELEALYDKMLDQIAKMENLSKKTTKGDFKNEVESIITRSKNEVVTINAEYQDWLGMTTDKLANTLANKIGSEMIELQKLIAKTKSLSPDVAKACDELLADLKATSSDYKKYAAAYQASGSLSPQDWMHHYDAVLVKFAYAKDHLAKMNKEIVRRRKNPAIINAIKDIPGLIEGFNGYLRYPERNYADDQRLINIVATLNTIQRSFSEGKIADHWLLFIKGAIDQLIKCKNDLAANLTVQMNNKKAAFEWLLTIDDKLKAAKKIVSPEAAPAEEFNFQEMRRRIQQRRGEADHEASDKKTPHFDRSDALFKAFSDFNADLIDIRGMETNLTAAKLEAARNFLSAMPEYVEKVERLAKEIEAMDLFYRAFQATFGDVVKAELDEMTELHRRIVTADLNDENLDELVAAFHALAVKNVNSPMVNIRMQQLIETDSVANDWAAYKSLQSIIGNLSPDAEFTKALAAKLEPYQQDFTAQLSASEYQDELINQLGMIIDAQSLASPFDRSQAIKADNPKDQFNHNAFVNDIKIRENELKDQIAEILSGIETSGWSDDKIESAKTLISKYAALKNEVEENKPDTLLKKLQAEISSLTSMLSQFNQLLQSPAVSESKDKIQLEQFRAEQYTDEINKLKKMIAALNVGDLKKPDNRDKLFAAINELPEKYRQAEKIARVMTLLKLLEYASIDAIIGNLAHPEKKVEIEKILNQLPDQCFAISANKNKAACIQSIINGDVDMVMMHFSDDADKQLAEFIIPAKEEIKAIVNSLSDSIKEDRVAHEELLKQMSKSEDPAAQIANLAREAHDAIGKLIQAQNRLLYFYYPDTKDAKGSVSGPTFDADLALKEANACKAELAPPLEALRKQYGIEKPKAIKFGKVAGVDQAKAAEQVRHELGLKLFERRQKVEKAEEETPDKKPPKGQP